MIGNNTPFSCRACAGNRAVLAILAALCGLCATGCGDPLPFDYQALGLAPTQESLVELSLGKFSVPIPVMIDASAPTARRSNRIQLDFELHVLVPPHQESRVSDTWEGHQGAIRDEVMLTCRSASIDDLQEPELGTLKSHLVDVLQDHLGKKEIRQVVITDFVSQEM